MACTYPGARNLREFWRNIVSGRNCIIDVPPQRWNPDVFHDPGGSFEDRVYTTVIPRNIRLGEAPSHGLPAVLYDVKSRGAEAYLALAREFLAREAAATPTEQHHG